MWTSVWKNCCALDDHLVGVIVTEVTGLCEDRNFLIENLCAVFFSNNFSHNLVLCLSNCIEESLCYAVADSCVDELACLFIDHGVDHFSKFTEGIEFLANELFSNNCFDEWDEVFSEEEWISAIEASVPAKFLELNKTAFSLGRNA